MPRYDKKIQVLFSEEQFRDLEVLASREHKKLGALVREAVVEYHLKKDKQRRIAEAVDRLLAQPETPVPENWEEWEAEYQKKKYSCP
jgi:ABC-type thiamine transport system substrate-binding protein